MRYSISISILILICLITLVLPSLAVAPAEHLIPVIVEGEPFTLTHTYRPMEGPGFVESFSVADLIASKKIVLPKSLVGIGDTPNRKSNAIKITTLAKSGLRGPIGWIRVQQPKRRSLYWFRGARVEVNVIDPKGRTLPGANYLCHASILIDCGWHDHAFPQSTPPYRQFLSLVQGMTNVMLPEGFGVPLASDEKLIFNMRTLNRVENRPVKIRMTLTAYLTKDDPSHPISALSWCRPSAAVKLAAARTTKASSDNCSSEFCRSEGKDAPNDINHNVRRDDQGNIISHHWVLPPGQHTYRSPIDLWKLTRGGSLRAVMPHVHFFCEQVQLVEHRPGYKSEILFTTHCKTVTKPNIRITHMDFLSIPRGIPIRKDASYGLIAVCNNTSGVDQDAMVAPIIFFSDLWFHRPLWAS